MSGEVEEGASAVLRRYIHTYDHNAYPSSSYSPSTHIRTQTFLDKTDQPFDPAWCGGTSGNQAPKTEWCSRINGELDGMKIL